MSYKYFATSATSHGSGGDMEYDSSTSSFEFQPRTINDVFLYILVFEVFAIFIVLIALFFKKK